MSFDYPIVYEDRNALRTSRWSLTGLNSKDAGNTAAGWLWVRFVTVGATMTVSLYKDAALASKVAEGSASIASVDGAAVKIALAASNSSGIGGELWLEEYIQDPAAAAPMLASLCVDADLAEEFQDLTSLPATIYDATGGMARFCWAASRKVLLLVGQMFTGQLGGSGAPEHRHQAGADRSLPDFRRLAAPDQLKDAAVHWALMLAFASCVERATETLYSARRDYHDAMRRECISAWNLAFNSDPDDDSDADRRQGVGSVTPTRM
ncbi:MAG: hypothetical protein ABFD92_16830 [Planctomycetaceae bacterium]|nr:hypothetical protein [Planctomycetaceae bacterium]